MSNSKIYANDLQVNSFPSASSVEDKSEFVIGIDIGDKNHMCCVLDATGAEVFCKNVKNTPDALGKFIAKYPKAKVAIEACLHSPWISRLLTEKAACKVYIANPRKTRAIWDTVCKTDKRDAQMLAKICACNPALLSPITHRSEDAQRDLQMVKARDALVEARTKLVNSVRASVKVMGDRLPGNWGAGAFAKKACEALPAHLSEIFSGLLLSIDELSRQIKEYDQAINNLCETKYPETQRLRQIKGVGPITALAFVLTIEDKTRFEKSRDIGAYLGLVPKRDQSGGTDKQLPITKAGDSYLRKLLVQCGQYILGAFGDDCELRRHGERIAARGGKNGKRRAIVAVARKLAIVMHRLWVSGSEYDPWYHAQSSGRMIA